MKFINKVIISPVICLSLLSLSVADTGLPDSAALFDTRSTVVEPNLVTCTLSVGTETQCMKINVTAYQTEHKMGPWCPRNISDTADTAGIWLGSGNVYDADGQFMENLAAFYKDDKWQLYDKVSGDINVTDTKEACQAAARPDVDPKYQNHCVQCLPEYATEEVKQTYLIPVKPILTEDDQALNPRSGIALAFNGVKFDAPAPIHAILDAYTIAPFDDCGGHVNPHIGYHYHAAQGCSKEVETADKSHAKMIGLALDGFALHSRLDEEGREPADLDACRGHETDVLGYHYHANDSGANQILGCFKAESGCAMRGDSTSCVSKGRRGPPPPGGKPPKPRS